MGTKWSDPKPIRSRVPTRRESPTMRITAIFPDGTCYAGDSYKAIEKQLRADVWNPSRKRAYRREMVLRAVVWSGWQLNRQSSAETFLKGMERAGMLRLEIEE